MSKSLPHCLSASKCKPVKRLMNSLTVGLNQVNHPLTIDLNPQHLLLPLCIIPYDEIWTKFHFFLYYVQCRLFECIHSFICNYDLCLCVVQDTGDEPPPLPPRWQAPAPNALCHAIYEDNRGLPPKQYSSCPQARHPASQEQDLDRSSTFRRPRKVSESMVYSYPSPMHAILMQYPNSETKTVVNEQGYLETTFPAGGDEPVCGHCHDKQKTCGAYGTNSKVQHTEDAKNGDVLSVGQLGLSPSELHMKSLGYDFDEQTHKREPNKKAGSLPGPIGLQKKSDQSDKRKFENTCEQAPPKPSRQSKTSQMSCNSDIVQTPERMTGAPPKPSRLHKIPSRESNILQTPETQVSAKRKMSRNARNLSSLSEEGYFSCSSELSFNAHTHSVTSLASNDSCCIDDSLPLDTVHNEQCFVVENDGRHNVYSFKAEMEHEDQVFV